MTTINVARVTTRDSIITKAIAHLADDQVVVTDRRGRELLRVEAPQRIDGAKFHYGEDTSVEVMVGACGCGSTAINPRPVDS